MNKKNTELKNYWENHIQQWSQSGKSQTDYGGYNKVGGYDNIIHSGCWAHARRKFVEAEKANNLEPYWYMRYLYTKLPYYENNDDLRKLLPYRLSMEMIREFFAKDKV